MNLKINKNEINKINFLDFLCDKTVSKININENYVEFNFFNTCSFNQNSEYQIFIHFGKNPADFINVYLYKIKKEKIKGKISSLESIINDNISFEVFDFGYMNSILFLKGSIIKNGKLNRNNILIEFYFEKNDFTIEIKQNLN